MNMRLSTIRLGWMVALTLACSLPSAAVAQHVNCERGAHADRIVIWQTIPEPNAVKRRPLTSDRLNTTSTRWIDTRRGFRPYSSVFGGCSAHEHHCYAAYDDHFGISRPENRPYSYLQRTPGTSVSVFRNGVNSNQQGAGTISIRRVHEPALQGTPPTDPPKVDMGIRIHNDRSVVPTTTGAVLVRSDGMVIQIGD